MSERPLMVAMDLEGVLVPEIWIAFAEKTGFDEFRMTTRDCPDYDFLMKRRISALHEHNLRLKDIQEVIGTMDPFDGAIEYIQWLRENNYQAVILSDTFYQFAQPLMRKLGWPTLFCNNLLCDADGNVTGYRMRLPDGKRHAALGFKQLNFDVIAMGDSYNDTAMLKEADLGILFRPAEAVRKQFPELPVVTTFEDLKSLISEHVRR